MVNILNDCGLTYIWNDHTLRNFNVQWLNITIKQNLSDQNEQFLSSEMHNSSKATCYKLFKDNINFEDYLDNLNDKDRILLCKYRTTNHRLIIETGRWRGINREDRICNLCNHGLIGDEFHYLLECRHFVISWRKDEDYRYFWRKYDKLQSKRDNKRPSGLKIGLGWVGLGSLRILRRFKGTRDIIKIHVILIRPTFTCSLRYEKADE